MSANSSGGTHAEEGELTERHRLAILIVLSLVVFLAVVNGTMVNIALPFIGQEFGVSESVYGWVVISFSLMFGVFSAIHGRLADRHGVRRLYLMGLAILGVSSVLVAMAPRIDLLIAMRFIQGAGSAAMPALGPVIIARTMPAARRGAALGVVLGAIGLAASIGPFLGGLIVQLFGWRAVFLMTGLVLVAFPLASRVLPRSLDEHRPSGRFDLVGAVLLGACATGFMLLFTVAERFGLAAPTLGLAAGLVLGATALVVWVRYRPDPFISPALFADARYAAMLAAGFATNATRFGTVVLVPALLVRVDGLEPIWIGVVLLPGALCIALLSRVAGRWSDRVGSRRPVIVGAIGVLGGNLVAAWFAGVGPVGVAAGMLLYGIGFAYIQSPLLNAVSWILPSHRAGAGTGLYMTIFFLGGAFGVSLSMTAVDLQPEQVRSWMGLAHLGEGAAYSNAILCLTVLALVPLAMTRWIPGAEMVQRRP